MPRGVLLEWHPVREVLVMIGWAKEKSSTWSLERQRHEDQPVAWGKPFPLHLLSLGTPGKEKRKKGSCLALGSRSH